MLKFVFSLSFSLFSESDRTNYIIHLYQFVRYEIELWWLISHDNFFQGYKNTHSATPHPSLLSRPLPFRDGTWQESSPDGREGGLGCPHRHHGPHLYAPPGCSPECEGQADAAACRKHSPRDAQSPCAQRGQAQDDCPEDGLHFRRRDDNVPSCPTPLLFAVLCHECAFHSWVFGTSLMGCIAGS